MGLLARLFLGDGTLKPALRDELVAEGLVALEENCPGTIRYTRFKAPGRRFNGKVVVERLALGVSEKRVVVYCRSGRVELIDSTFDQPRLAAVTVMLDGDDKVVFEVDYDRMGEPNVSGRVAIRVRTPHAAMLVGQLNDRLDR